MFPFDFFRANAGAVIINSKGQVLAFERSDTKDAWQFPQGGIDYDEEPFVTIKREIFEETGIKADDNLELVAEHPEWLVYEFPRHTRPKGWSRGQAQKWFLFKVKNDDIKPDLQRAESPEFVAWKWTDIDEVVEQMIFFKKPVYEKVADWVKKIID